MKKSKSAMQGIKFKMTLGLPLEALTIFVDYSGKRIYISLQLRESKQALNILPATFVGDMVFCTVKKGNQNK